MTPSDAWPDLPYAEWRDTYATLHLWTQVVGKVRLALAPWVAHSWHAPLYVTARGLGTSTMYAGERALQIDFDFVDHRLVIAAGDGATRALPLEPRSVADFHARAMDSLRGLGVEVAIHTTPAEIADAIPFERDTVHASYDREQADRFRRALLQANRVLTDFRSRYLGKCSPVHFFWGGFDLAVTRFSGREAPPHPGGVPNMPDWVARDAYSHEVSSAGWWPGGELLPEPAFYSYTYPEPPGFADSRVSPAEARYDPTLREFLLPWSAVRAAREPAARAMDFLESTYRAGAGLAGWDRAALESPWLERPDDPRWRHADADARRSR